MQIIFDNKLPEQDILQKSSKILNDNIDQAKFDAEKNILIKGDNFDAMSLLMNEYKGKVDLVYIDPPYNTAQDFFISDTGKSNTISRSKTGSVAYSDKMSRDEFLEFIRERLILIRELLSDEGSLYLHIDYKVGHYIKILMDEVFNEVNFRNDITRIKSNPKNFFRKAYGNEKDLILFYTKSKKNIWNDVKVPLSEDEKIKLFPKVEPDGRRYTTIPLHAPGETKGPTSQPWKGIAVPEGRHWRRNPKEFDKLDAEGRIEWSSKGNPRIKNYADEHEGKKIQDVWLFKDPLYPVYPTEKNSQMLNLIIRQSSNPGSIVMDCFAGSGSTLKSAELLGRRWIGIDNSDVAINIIRQRMLSLYEYREIALKHC